MYRRTFLGHICKLLFGTASASAAIMLTSGQQYCYPQQRRISVWTATSLYLLEILSDTGIEAHVGTKSFTSGGCGQKVMSLLLPSGLYKSPDLVFEVNGQQLDSEVTIQMLVSPDLEEITWKDAATGVILLTFVVPQPPECFPSEECS